MRQYKFISIFMIIIMAFSLVLMPVQEAQAFLFTVVIGFSIKTVVIDGAIIGITSYGIEKVFDLFDE